MQAHEEVDYSKKLDLSLWKRLLAIAKPYHKHLWWIVITMAICAVCDVIFPCLRAMPSTISSPIAPPRAWEALWLCTWGCW